MTSEISNLIFNINNQIATLRELALQHGEEMPKLREQTEHQISTFSALKEMVLTSNRSDKSVSLL